MAGLHSQAASHVQQAHLQDDLVTLVFPLLKVQPRVRDPQPHLYSCDHHESACNDGFGAEAGVPQRVREVQHCTPTSFCAPKDSQKEVCMHLRRNNVMKCHTTSESVGWGRTDCAKGHCGTNNGKLHDVDELQHLWSICMHKLVDT